MTEVLITCANNGPLRITGNFILKDAQGNVFDLSGRETVAFCRCGFSENKPFCDGSHNRKGFSSEIQARKLPPPAPKPAL
jgi:CDGSH-type Zn-finger protein